MSITIAVDIGGTHIRVAAYPGESTTSIAHHRTCSYASEPGVFDRLVQAIEAIWPSESVSAIGIASPGPLDPYTDPSILIFGGGVSQVGDLLFKPLEESLRKHTIHPHYLENLVIAKAVLGDDAGLLGALALARLALPKVHRDDVSGEAVSKGWGQNDPH